MFTSKVDLERRDRLHQFLEHHINSSFIYMTYKALVCGRSGV